MLKTVLLSKIKDNPYRDKKRNPVDKTRVEQLVESIGTTGFWKGIYGREVGDKVEIAFGHTRVDAAREAGLKEIPVEIEKLSDSDMLMRMTRENLRGELLVSLEAVSAVVKAFGEGAVAFEDIDPSTRKEVLRYAPSFVPGKQPSTPGVLRPYTADTLARFLGGVYVKQARGGKAQNSVLAALGILEMEERKVSGFSERTLRVAADEGTTYLGAKKIIQIVSDVKQREVKVAARTEDAKKEAARLDAEQRKIQTDRKAAEEKAEAARQKLVEQIAAAKKDENDKRAAELKVRLEEKKAQEAEDDVLFKVRQAALNAQVEERKKREAETKKVDAYAPIKREVERILHKLDGSTATTRDGLGEEVKALARQTLTPTDRERLRQAAISTGNWFMDWVAMQFIPPFAGKRDLTEYRRREEAARRALEAKTEAARLKEERAQAKKEKRANT